MTKEHKIVAKAREAKSKGYVYIASIVKHYKASKYYHVVLIDDVLEAGRWIPSVKQQCGAWVGRVGQLSSTIDWSKTIERSCM